MTAISSLASLGGQASTVYNAITQIFGGAGQVILGEFTFAGVEVPPSIQWGGRQRIIENVEPGGNVNLQPMGVIYPPLTWGGHFEGFTALRRAKTLYLMMTDGQERSLTWNDKNYTVIIESFQATDENPAWVPYSITVRVLRDEALAGTPAPLSLFGQLSADVQAALGITPATLSAVSTAITDVQTALQAAGAVSAGTAGNASASTAAAIAQAEVAAALSGANGAMGAVIVPAGANVLPSGTGAAGAASATTAMVASAQLASLLVARGKIGRAQVNLRNAST